MNTLLRTVAWLAAFLGGAATAFAYGDPKETYAELESDHFIIHYPESRYAFALRAIAIAEVGWTQLALRDYQDYRRRRRSLTAAGYTW